MFEFIGIWAVLGFGLVTLMGLFASELDSGVLAIATYILTVLTVQYGLGFSVIASFIANPLLFIGTLIAYGILGVLYAGLWKWPNFIRKHDAEIMSNYQNWCMPRSKLNKDVSFDTFLDSDDFAFNVWYHKERLATWASVWIFSMVWELLHKPVKWLWNVLYTGFGDIFQNIGKKTARNLHNRK